MSKAIWSAVSLVAMLVAFAGCSKPAADNVPTSGLHSDYVLSAEPAEAQDVKTVVKDATDKGEIVMVGRIGGSADPWVDDLAVFTVVDRSLKPCNETGEPDHCPVPWDYCCEPEVAENTVTVKVVDSAGKPVATGARELLGVKELDTVVVRGRAQVDPEGNLVVLAEGVFIKR